MESPHQQEIKKLSDYLLNSQKDYAIEKVYKIKSLGKTLKQIIKKWYFIFLFHLIQQSFIKSIIYT